jgi:hypothetical protein
MRRLSGWLKQIFRPRGRVVKHDNLPFSAEEFARLISSGKSEDMKVLAQGLSRSTLLRDERERARL